MTREEFEAEYATRSGVTVEWLREHGQHVEACECGDAICTGWAMVGNGPEQPRMAEDGPRDPLEDAALVKIATSCVCRWCGETTDDLWCGACIKCGAATAAAIEMKSSQAPIAGWGVRLWWNPDNSVYVEFMKGERVSRYTLDPTVLMEQGKLRLFNKDPNGKRNP